MLRWQADDADADAVAMETAGREAGATDYQVVEQQLRRGGQLGCMDYDARLICSIKSLTRRDGLQDALVCNRLNEMSWSDVLFVKSVAVYDRLWCDHGFAFWYYSRRPTHYQLKSYRLKMGVQSQHSRSNQCKARYHRLVALLSTCEIIQVALLSQRGRALLRPLCSYFQQYNTSSAVFLPRDAYA